MTLSRVTQGPHAEGRLLLLHPRAPLRHPAGTRFGEQKIAVDPSLRLC